MINQKTKPLLFFIFLIFSYYHIKSFADMENQYKQQKNSGCSYDLAQFEQVTEYTPLRYCIIGNRFLTFYLQCINIRCYFFNHCFCFGVLIPDFENMYYFEVFRKTKSGFKASVQFFNDGKTVVNSYKNTNIADMFHEIGHLTVPKLKSFLDPDEYDNVLKYYNVNINLILFYL